VVEADRPLQIDDHVVPPRGDEDDLARALRALNAPRFGDAWEPLRVVAAETHIFDQNAILVREQRCLVG
jgi:hypothetical protein